MRTNQYFVAFMIGALISGVFGLIHGADIIVLSFVITSLASLGTFAILNLLRKRAETTGSEEGKWFP